MADPVVKFEPFLTQQWAPKDLAALCLIIDRNLLEIKKALLNTNVTFEQVKNTFTNDIQNISFSFGSGVQGRQGIDGNDGDDGLPGVPGQPGRDGAPGPVRFGLDGDDGLDGFPGVAGVQGLQGIQGRAGLDGNDGDDAGGFLPLQEISGLPLGTLPSEYTATGDSATTLNGDSRIRSAYSRVVVGPYIINDPAILYVEDGAVLGVF